LIFDLIGIFLKLNIVPARTGFTWVSAGIRAFARQPLALSGLFFMFMALLSLVSLLPLLGSALALTLLPGATLGLMAATRESLQGKFPMPLILLSAFRAGRQRLHAMLLLGLLYAGGFLLVLAASSVADGGEFARLYLVGGKISTELLETADFQAAAWLALLLYLPLSLLFWHAPGLVHWHGVPPLKSLFFSAVACLKNFGALTVFGLTWVAVFILVGIAMTLVATLLGVPGIMLVGWLPVVMVLLAMFFTSIYFSFHDSFVGVEPGL
jgi:hypothetical protein